jgi:hypothetical protein
VPNNVEELRAHVQSLAKQMAALTRDVRQIDERMVDNEQQRSTEEANHLPGAHSEDAAEEEAPETAESLAAFCIEQAMAPLEPTLRGVVATLQMLVLTAFQTVFAHSFFDTTWLHIFTREFDFAEPDPVANPEFYILRPCPDCPMPHGFDRTFSFNCDGPGDMGHTCYRKSRMALITSLAAILLFAAGPLLLDDQQTMSPHGAPRTKTSGVSGVALIWSCHRALAWTGSRGSRSTICSSTSASPVTHGGTHAGARRSSCSGDCPQRCFCRCAGHVVCSSSPGCACAAR